MSLIAKEKCKRCRLKKKLIEEGTMLRKLKIKNRGQFSQSENYQSYKNGLRENLEVRLNLRRNAKLVSCLGKVLNCVQWTQEENFGRDRPINSNAKEKSFQTRQRSRRRTRVVRQGAFNAVSNDFNEH